MYQFKSMCKTGIYAPSSNAAAVFQPQLNAHFVDDTGESRVDKDDVNYPLCLHFEVQHCQTCVDVYLVSNKIDLLVRYF